MTSAVVIGANGQLGSDLMRAKPSHCEIQGFRRADFDVTDREQTRNSLLSLRPEVVINTAAFHKIDVCEDEPEKTFAVNSIAVRDLAATVQEWGGVFVQISTDYVFSGKERTEPYTESDAPDPINTYGVSKVAGELFALENCEKAYVVRVSSLFGRAGASGKGGNFITTIRDKGGRGEPLRVVDDIKMTPTYTLDAAKMIWSLVSDQRPYGTYHVSNDGVSSWYELAKETLRQLQIEREIEPIPHSAYPTKAQKPLWSALSSAKEIELPHWKDALGRYLSEIS